MSKIFNQIENTNVKGNIFDLGHERKLSTVMGEITPILVLDCVPGDKINLQTSQMLRLAPLVSPVMHKINTYTHFYFVPNRLVWDNWEPFITGGEDGLADPAFPTLKIGGQDQIIGGLADHMGLPVTMPFEDIAVSAIPFAAYQLIYSEYYRDQNLIENDFLKLSDGELLDPLEIQELTRTRIRAYEHDYFTSALPWTQKGAEATIPLGTFAPIEWAGGFKQTMRRTDGSIVNNLDLATGSAQNRAFGDTGNSENWYLNLEDSHAVDLSSATAASINDLRQAFRLQEWLEKNARGGSRYIEIIKSHFGITSKDARLQRPEYLGGGRSAVQISEVLQTQGSPEGEDPNTTPQGNMAGHGISVGTMNNFKYHATEHGYIIGVMSILPRTSYFQGIPKHFNKFDKFDYYWPAFANLGEQPILNQELFVLGDPKDQETFGYTPRYAEYKQLPSTVHGEFKTSLEFWHMARKFDQKPSLNQLFVQCNPSDDNLNRIFAVPDSEKIYVQIMHNIKAYRLMPFFGTPKM